MRGEQSRRYAGFADKAVARIEGIAVDRADQASVLTLGDHRDQHAAFAAQEELGLVRALSIPLQKVVADMDLQLAMRIGDPGRTMARAELAVAGARRHFLQRHGAVEAPTQGAAVAAAR